MKPACLKASCSAGLHAVVEKGPFTLNDDEYEYDVVKRPFSSPPIFVTSLTTLIANITRKKSFAFDFEITLFLDFFCH